MSAVLMIVVSATVLLLLAMTMFYMNQAPADMIYGFQAKSENCSFRGGQCMEKGDCEGQVVSGKCGKIKTENSGEGVTKFEAVSDPVCCYNP